MDVLPLVSRIIHIFSAVALVGGWIFLLVGVLPALRLVEASLTESIIELAARKYYRVTHLACVLLVVTGAYNWYLNLPIYRNEKIKAAINPLIGTKALIGIVIVMIVFLSAFKVLPGSPTRWAKVNLVLATVVIILAAVVRQMRLSV